MLCPHSASHFAHVGKCMAAEACLLAEYHVSFDADDKSYLALVSFLPHLVLHYLHNIP